MAANDDHFWTTVGSSETYVVESRWKSREMELRVTNGSHVWAKAFFESDFLGSSAEDRLKSLETIKDALSGKGDVSKYEVAIDLGVDGFCTVLIKICPELHVKIKLGSFRLPRVGTRVEEIFEEIAGEIWGFQNSERELQRRLKSLQQQRDQLSILLHELPEKRRKHTDIMTTEFVDLLNAKKKKIRRHMAGIAPEPTSTAATASTAASSNVLSLHLSSEEEQSEDEFAMVTLSTNPHSSGTFSSQSQGYSGQLAVPAPAQAPTSSEPPQTRRPTLRRAVDALGSSSQ